MDVLIAIIVFFAPLLLFALLYPSKAKECSRLKKKNSELSAKIDELHTRLAELGRELSCLDESLFQANKELALVKCTQDKESTKDAQFLIEECPPEETLATSGTQCAPASYAARHAQAVKKRWHHRRKMGICFTGFSNSDKTRLIAEAEASGLFFVRSSVTVNLDFLCCGASPGPAKIEKAKNQRVHLLSEDQFLNLLQTGEVPELRS